MLTALLAKFLPAIATLLVGFFAGVSKSSQHIVEKWWDARQEKRKNAEAWAPPMKNALIIADDLRIVPPTYWRIENYNADGPATGFRALLVVTRVVPRMIQITALDARLPWRLRRKHRVVHALLDAKNPSQDLTDQIAPTHDTAFNFYVQPPVAETAPITVVIRLRDQFRTWHEHQITFVAQRT